MKIDAVERAISIAGSQKALAQRCGRAQSTVCDWLNGKVKISPENVLRLVSATDGQIKGHEFRPDLPDLFPPPSSN